MKIWKSIRDWAKPRRLKACAYIDVTTRWMFWPVVGLMVYCGDPSLSISFLCFEADIEFEEQCVWSTRKH